MLKMSQVNYIRDLSNSGYRIAEISKKLNLDRKTVRKYLNQEDFSPTPPVRHPAPSKLAPYKPKILKWLAEDQHVWQKQQHTAKRILDRLREEDDFDGSYSIVQRYVKSVRHAQQARATQELVWEPGSAQVDFGEADFNVNGLCRRMKYLTVSFPYSNDGFTQVFGGETAECVCQGLRNIFEYIGGVPPLLIFDNATGVGRRVGSQVHETELFRRFRAHYGCRVKFCNPYAGYEKGNVERKVGYVRANLFVPVPRNQGLSCLQPRAPEATRGESAGDALQERRPHCCAFRRRPCRTAIGGADKIWTHIGLRKESMLYSEEQRTKALHVFHNGSVK